ncbi:MAG: hypothetical protein Q8L29_01965 [archaeon]|nr:hypothetical protein [archaeon]
MKVFLGGKNIDIPVRKVSFLGMTRGLMFRFRDTRNLFFDNFNGAIHSWFVFFPFLAIWLDKNNKVVEYEIIKSWRSYIKPKKKFAKLVEIPLNSKNKKIIDFFIRRLKNKN